MKLLKHAFSHGQPSSVRLATSQPCSPETELTEYIDEARSRQSSNSTTRTSSTGSSSLPIKIGEPIVAIHMTPMKDGNEKVSMFVFVLATGM